MEVAPRWLCGRSATKFNRRVRGGNARRGRREFDIGKNFRVAKSMARVSAQLTRAFAWFGLSARVNGVIA